MAQQPNVEIAPEQMPTPGLEPTPARRNPIRPGQILAPEDKPEGPAFGWPGPDTGFALRIIEHAEVAQDDERLQRVLAALMGARAAHFGRAPTAGDLQAALRLVGLAGERSDDLDARRERWLAALSHERTPGQTAVAEAGDALYATDIRA